MFRGFKERAIEPEMMDDFSKGGIELQKALQHLRIINGIFGASAPTLYGVQRLWNEANKPRHLSILDIGSGSGDVNRRILKWADKNQIDLKITLVDITEEACEEARQFFHNEPRVEVIRSDLFELSKNCADLVTGTQFVHHFAADDLQKVIVRMLKASRIGIVVNDIHRHWIPWTAVWLTSRIISNNQYILNDAPLSVAKGFRLEDWKNLEKALGELNMFYSWRPLFRYVVIIGKHKI